MKIGHHIRMRRKKLKLSQQELADNEWTRSYISQIEGERIQPSLDTVAKLATRLDTTISDLVADGLQLRKAKATILYPDLCLSYLESLPQTPTTIFLAELTNSLLSKKSLECKFPPNSELYYLTARVLIFQENYQSAKDILQQGLRFTDEIWRYFFLAKLCFVNQKLNHADYSSTKEKLTNMLLAVDSLDDIKTRILEELKYEIDPTRAQDLVNFLTLFEMDSELQEFLNITNL